MSFKKTLANEDVVAIHITPKPSTSKYLSKLKGFGDDIFNFAEEGSKNNYIVLVDNVDWSIKILAKLIKSWTS